MRVALGLLGLVGGVGRMAARSASTGGSLFGIGIGGVGAGREGAHPTAPASAGRSDDEDVQPGKRMMGRSWQWIAIPGTKVGTGMVPTSK